MHYTHQSEYAGRKGRTQPTETDRFIQVFGQALSLALHPRALRLAGLKPPSFRTIFVKTPLFEDHLCGPQDGAACPRACTLHFYIIYVLVSGLLLSLLILYFGPQDGVELATSSPRASTIQTHA